MDRTSDWLNAWADGAAAMGRDVLAYLPNLFGALALLIVGWLVARLLSAGVVRFGDVVNTLVDRALPERRFRRFRLSAGVLKLLASIVFWVVILVTVTVASQVLGLAIFSDWLATVVSYLPTLFAGALIVLAGVVIGNILRDVVAAAAGPWSRSHGQLLGRATQYATLAVGLIIGFDQIGIDVTILVVLVALTLAMGLGGLALAFALGARPLVENLIGAHHCRRHYRVGGDVRFGPHEGRVLEITPTMVLLATDDGELAVPARAFLEEASLIRAEAAEA